MAAINDRFLDLYREYETVLRDSGTDYRAMEEGSDGIEQERLRITRQMRNYLTHNHDAGFLAVSDRQVAFLEQRIKDERMAGDILKKHLKTVKAGTCGGTEKIADVLVRFARLGVSSMPMCEVPKGETGARIVGVVSVYDLLRAYMAEQRPKTAKMSALKKVGKRCPTMAPMTPMETVIGSQEPIICCTDTGTAAGKVIGVYFRDIC